MQTHYIVGCRSAARGCAVAATFALAALTTGCLTEFPDSQIQMTGAGGDGAGGASTGGGGAMDPGTPLGPMGGAGGDDGAGAVGGQPGAGGASGGAGPGVGGSTGGQTGMGGQPGAGGQMPVGGQTGAGGSPPTEPFPTWCTQDQDLDLDGESDGRIVQRVDMDRVVGREVDEDLDGAIDVEHLFEYRPDMDRPGFNEVVVVYRRTADGQSTYAELEVYDPDERLVERYVDEDGERDGSASANYGETYQYDANGQLERIDIDIDLDADPSGTPEGYADFLRDGMGRIVERRIHRVEGDELIRTSVYTYLGDTEMEASQIDHEGDSNGAITQSYQYSYDSNGNRTRLVARSEVDGDNFNAFFGYVGCF